MASKEFITGLLELYRDHPSLWKTTSTEYTNRKLKKKSYEELVVYCKQFFKKADKAFVRQKLQNLRTAFRKEWRRADESKRSGAGSDDIYVPRLWYYDLLLFTCDASLPQSSLDIRKRRIQNECSGETDIKKEDETERKDCKDKLENEIQSSEDSEGQNSECNGRHSSLELVAGPSKYTQVSISSATPEKNSIKERRIKRNKEEPFVEECSKGNITPFTKQEIDEYDALGISWVSKVRKLNEVQKILAEDLINQILKKAYFQELTRNTVLHELPSSTTS